MRGLTKRETETLQWVRAGKTNAEIAQIMGISPYTVKNSLQHIFSKLNVTNRTAAAMSKDDIGVRDTQCFAGKDLA